MTNTNISKIKTVFQQWKIEIWVSFNLFYFYLQLICQYIPDEIFFQGPNSPTFFLYAKLKLKHSRKRAC